MLSEDARWLLYELTPPYDALADYSEDEPRYNSQIVVVDLNRASREPQTLALGLGTWISSLSPRGDKVAILWRTATTVHAGVYHLRTRQLVSFDFQPVVDFHQSDPVWLNNDELVYSTTDSEEASPAVGFRRDAARIRSELWQDAWAGVRSTATVVTTPIERPALRRGRLLRVNAHTGATQLISNGRFVGLSLSGDRRFLAAAQQGQSLPIGRADSPLATNNLLFVPIVFDLVAGSSDLSCDTCAVLGNQRFEWASDSARVAFFGRALDRPWDQLEAHVFDAGNRTRERFAPSDIAFASQRERGLPHAPESVFPTAQGILVYGRPRSSADPDLTFPRPLPNSAPQRADWYFVSDSGTLVNVTAETLDPLPVIHRDHCEFSRDDQVRMRLRQVGAVGALENRSEACMANRLDVDVQPLQGGRTRIVLQADSQRRASVQVRGTLSDPVAQADGPGYAAFVSVDRGLSRILVLNSAGGTEYETSFNTHLRDIEPATREYIRHSFRGVELNSCIQLPRRISRPVPLVVVVYPDLNDCHPYWQQGFIDAYTPELLVGANYAVLYLSAPTSLLADGDDPVANWGRVADAALNAIDNERLPVQTDNVGALGVSQGAISALALIGQSDRYRAVVAISGAYNFISHYGQIGEMRLILSDDLFSMGQSSRYEVSYYPRLGSTPWERPDQYEAASPIFDVEHVTAPVLLIATDLDWNFPLAQADEYFTALYRLGRKAEYVVYWGEGHAPTSPANIRDAQRRILCWFETHLRSAEAQHCAAP